MGVVRRAAYGGVQQARILMKLLVQLHTVATRLTSLRFSLSRSFYWGFKSVYPLGTSAGKIDEKN